VNITGGNTICNGNYDTLVAIGATSYTWSANAGYNDTAIVHPTSSITIYTVTGMTSGCYATDTIKVNIDQIPFGMFNIVQDALPNTWDAYPTYSSNVAYCKWDWGDSSSTYGLYPNHIYTNPGRYNICMTVYTGYCNDSTVYCLSDSLYRVAINVGNTPVYVNVLHSTTGVNMLTNFNNNIAVHPNPAENQITVQSSPELGSIVINNSLGEVIFQVVSKNASEQIDISKFPAGMYFIEAKNKRIKLIKN
ncbi:MAG: T9SS type A sorting domain-containing protein, partial [Bacteroidia bacterium]